MLMIIILKFSIKFLDYLRVFYITKIFFDRLESLVTSGCSTFAPSHRSRREDRHVVNPWWHRCTCTSEESSLGTHIPDFTQHSLNPSSRPSFSTTTPMASSPTLSKTSSLRPLSSTPHAKTSPPPFPPRTASASRPRALSSSKTASTWHHAASH